MVDSLEDELVDFKSFVGLEGQTHHLERICQSLHANTDRSVSHVRGSSLRDGIVVAVDNFVQIFGDSLGDFMKILVIKSFGFKVRELGKRNAGKITNSHFILVCVFHDLGAEIRALDSSQVLLIALAIASIFVEHVGSACLNLGVNDLLPQPACLDLFSCATLLLILSVQCLEFVTPALEETGALVGAHERPVCIGLNSLHEKVWDPEGIKQVPRAVLFCAIVLAQLKELVNVGMPWLQVDSEGTLAFAAALVDVSGSVVVDF